MKKLVVAFAALAVAIGASLGTSAQEKDEDGKPKYNIKEVMAKAHKNKLYDKVARGDASAEEKKMLLDLYVALAENEPPKGDSKAWKAHTKVLVEAAKAAVEDKEGSGEALRKAANCGACHNAHRGKAGS